MDTITNPQPSQHQINKRIYLDADCAMFNFCNQMEV